MKIINLTRHVVTCYDSEGVNILMRFFPSGKTARLESEQVRVGTLENGVALTRTEFGQVVNLPETVKEGTYYIVSALIKAAYPHRPDLLVPASTIRRGGVILGCRSLGV